MKARGRKPERASSQEPPTWGLLAFVVKRAGKQEKGPLPIREAAPVEIWAEGQSLDFRCAISTPAIFSQDA